MRKLFQKLILIIYLRIHFVLINIGILLYRTEDQVFGIPNDLQEKDKRVQRKLHRNPLLEKFYAGERDEKYVQDYYEVLKRADKFMRTASPHQIAVAADKHLRFEDDDYSNENVLEKKDKYGRRYSHFGFFDDKHKHAGKTVGEVLEMEMKERRTKDDDYELLYIFNNKPIEVGLANIMDVVEKSDKIDFEYKVIDIFRKSKSFEFPIKAHRIDENVVNKIEHLTEYLHVKKIGFEYRQLEFFIPLKFKTEEIEENSEIFNDIININSIFVKNEYGELMGFGINKLIKRIRYNDTHEVWKFEGIEMQTVSLK